MLLRSFHFGSSTLLDPSRIILKNTQELAPVLPLAASGSMLEFLAGWLTCALTVLAFYLWSEYSRHRRNDQHLLDDRFRAEHPAKHKAKAALRQ